MKELQKVEPAPTPEKKEKKQKIKKIEKSKYILKNKASEINKLYKNEFDTNNLYLENEQKKNKYNNKYNNKNNRKIGKNNENDQSLFNSNTFIDMNSNNNSNRKMKKNVKIISLMKKVKNI